MDGITKALFLLVIVLHSNTGVSFKLTKVFEKLDDLELDVVTERIERRKSFRKIEQSLENIEGRLNISLAQGGQSGGEIQQIERKLNDIKEQSGATKLEEISETFQLLRKGFNAEKKQSVRLRRRVSQIEGLLALLSNNSEMLTKNIFSFFEDLRDSNTNMKEMYENTSDALLHVTGILDSMSSKIVNAVSSVVETTINETIKGFSHEIRLAIRFPHCKVSERPNSCLELLQCGHTQSGVYTVTLEDQAIKVYCDQERDGGGWTVFQRRQDGSVDFFRNWLEYRNGFGDLHGEFWLGNENLHRLLSVKSRYELRVDLGDFADRTAYAKYSQFMVGPESENYVLTAEGYSGDAGDSLSHHSGHPFSTKDRDNDRSSSSCSHVYRGSWWYKSCHYSNLNGLYNTDKQSSDPKNVCWYHLKNGYHPLKFSEMKFREHVQK